MDLVSELKGDLCIVTNALRKIKGKNGEDEEAAKLEATLEVEKALALSNIEIAEH